MDGKENDTRVNDPNTCAHNSDKCVIEIECDVTPPQNQRYQRNRVIRSVCVHQTNTDKRDRVSCLRGHVDGGIDESTVTHCPASRKRAISCSSSLGLWHAGQLQAESNQSMLCTTHVDANSDAHHVSFLEVSSLIWTPVRSVSKHLSLLSCHFVGKLWDSHQNSIHRLGHTLHQRSGEVILRAHQVSAFPDVVSAESWMSNHLHTLHECSKNGQQQFVGPKKTQHILSSGEKLSNKEKCVYASLALRGSPSLVCGVAHAARSTLCILTPTSCSSASYWASGLFAVFYLSPVFRQNTQCLYSPEALRGWCSGVYYLLCPGKPCERREVQRLGMQEPDLQHGSFTDTRT